MIHEGDASSQAGERGDGVRLSDGEEDRDG